MHVIDIFTSDKQHFAQPDIILFSLVLGKKLIPRFLLSLLFNF